MATGGTGKRQDYHPDNNRRPHFPRFVHLILPNMKGVCVIGVQKLKFNLENACEVGLIFLKVRKKYHYWEQIQAVFHCCPVR
jgi:hypothetical protein